MTQDLVTTFWNHSILRGFYMCSIKGVLATTTCVWYVWSRFEGKNTDTINRSKYNFFMKTISETVHVIYQIVSFLSLVKVLSTKFIYLVYLGLHT